MDYNPDQCPVCDGPMKDWKAVEMSAWQPIETVLKDTRVWAWGDNWNWRVGHPAVFHSDYNGHKDVVTQNGIAGPTFRIGKADAPTHWMPLPEPPTASEAQQTGSGEP